MPLVGTGTEPVGFELADDPPEGVPVELLNPLASCAKPTAGGFAWYTEYTFFRNVSPTIQDGTPWPLPTVLPISKIPPTHNWAVVPVPVKVPRFMSAALMGQLVPPKEMETEMAVVHGYAYNPAYCPSKATEPGTSAQIL